MNIRFKLERLGMMHYLLFSASVRTKRTKYRVSRSVTRAELGASTSRLGVFRRHRKSMVRDLKRAVERAEGSGRI